MRLLCNTPVRAVLAPLACILAACFDSSPSGPGAGPAPGTLVRFTTYVSGITGPVDLTAPPGDNRQFLAEQTGRIRIIRDGVLLPTPFLDIRSLVRSGGEQGLLGLAFHPQYAGNGFFFVHYTGLDGHTRIVRYRVSDDQNQADATSATTLLTVEQPQSNHNGGRIAFGPDGMLYIGLGDGGGAGDPAGNGQNPNTLLGSLLRVDVDAGEPYAIPAGNPFAGGGGLPEIWAIGLRNPWRFSFDHERNLIFIADVGQSRREEVNVQPAAVPGLNYGWNRMEGGECFPQTASCNPAAFVIPTLEYVNPGEGCAITGGFVYRGSRIPALRGYYVFGDFCAGWVRAFRYDGGQPNELRELGFDLGSILSFGQDAAGELYVLTAGGTVYRIDPAS